MEQYISTIHDSAYCFFTTCDPDPIHAEMINYAEEENIIKDYTRDKKNKYKLKFKIS